MGKTLILYNYIMQTYRLSQINATLRKEISQILIEINEPEWGMVSITDVQISSDLLLVKIWLSACSNAVSIIQNHASIISKKLRPRLKLKYQPSLKFIKDNSDTNRVEELLEQLNESKKSSL